MSFEQISYLAQTVASVAVVASLIFVALQIKQNTAALQRNEHNSTMAQWTVIRMAIAKHRDIAELMTAGLHGENPLDAADQLRLEQMLQENAGRLFTFGTERSAVSFRRGLSKRQLEHAWAPCSERRVARAGGAKPNILASLLGCLGRRRRARQDLTMRWSERRTVLRPHLR